MFKFFRSPNRGVKGPVRSLLNDKSLQWHCKFNQYNTKRSYKPKPKSKQKLVFYYNHKDEWTHRDFNSERPPISPSSLPLRFMLDNPLICIQYVCKYLLNQSLKSCSKCYLRNKYSQCGHSCAAARDSLPTISARIVRSLPARRYVSPNLLQRTEHRSWTQRQSKRLNGHSQRFTKHLLEISQQCYEQFQTTYKSFCGITLIRERINGFRT